MGVKNWNSSEGIDLRNVSCDRLFHELKNAKPPKVEALLCCRKLVKKQRAAIDGCPNMINYYFPVLRVPPSALPCLFRYRLQ